MNQKYIDKETNEQNFQKALINNDADGMWQAVFADVGTTLITIFEGNSSFLEILYEATSAIGTVGLSTGLTSGLCTTSKFVVMVMMYIGRIGPVTFVLAFASGKKTKDSHRQLPVQGILIG